MDKRKIIIDMFSNSPETWTAEQLETIGTVLNVAITKNDLLKDYAAKINPIVNHLKLAITERETELQRADFEHRLNALQFEILPAAEFLETIEKQLPIN